VGTFKNIHSHPPVWDAGARKGRTFHWFDVNIDDLGEPGNREEFGATCPAGGFTCADDPGGFAKCDCADFYRIKIFAPFDFEGGESPKMGETDVIYHVEGYIIGGNFQIHPPIR